MSHGFRPIVAIDFDGTIKTSPRFEIYNEPQKDCKEVIERLHKAGCRLILWTCRGYKNEDGSSGGLEEAIDYLKHYGMYEYFIAFNENIKELNFKAYPKIFADYYVDDRGIAGLPTWLAVEEIIMQDEYFVGKQV
jgi:hypothetical protein